MRSYIGSPGQGRVAWWKERLPTRFHFSFPILSSMRTTITAELIGQFTHIPPQGYTGIPVKTIIAEAGPLHGLKAQGDSH